MLEQNTTKKERVDEKVTELEFEAGDSNEYKVKAICNRDVYGKEAKSPLPGLYYLVTWKGYSKKENI